MIGYTINTILLNNCLKNKFPEGKLDPFFFYIFVLTWTVLKIGEFQKNSLILL